jgi:ABC-type antimicrobial peptide transport system permease subunit
MRLTTPSGTVPAPVASLLERQWGAFAPRRFKPLAEDVAVLTAPWRARSILFGLIAALCVPLAVVGLAGALLHTVRSRHREIAIRLALGADPGRVRRAIVGRALASAGAGVFVGLAGGIGIGPLMASQLFGVHPADPGTIAAVTAGMAAVAWAAAWWPARRAGRIAPAAALKDA